MSSNNNESAFTEGSYVTTDHGHAHRGSAPQMHQERTGDGAADAHKEETRVNQ